MQLIGDDTFRWTNNHYFLIGIDFDNLKLYVVDSLKWGWSLGIG